MGIIRMGPPHGLIVSLAKACGIRTFVETGTFRGYTALWASRHFAEVVTIEKAPSLHAQVIEKHARIRNIRFLLGDTTEHLPEIVGGLRRPAVFWLDAHWSGGETSGEDCECPLIQELETINQSDVEHLLFIDDARLFTSPPPPPHDVGQWPDVCALFEAIRGGQRERYTIIHDDVVISVPATLREDLLGYLSRQAERGVIRGGRRMVSRIARPVRALWS